jgi:hypothetical protein
VKERVAGLWCSSAPHPEWTPGHGWQRDIWACCVDTEDAVVVVDPITPLGDEARELDEWIANRQKPVVVALSRAGHFRDSAAFSRRYEAIIYGDPRAGERVPPDVEFHAVSAGDALPGGACVLAFDVPGLDHTPLYLSSHRAIVPGDIVVRAEGELRLWWVPENDDDLRFLNERHIPALRRWLEFPIDHVLTSHGTPTLGGGGCELAAALARPIWSIS